MKKYKRIDARKVVEEAMGDVFRSHEFDAILDINAKREYAQNAQIILDSVVFKNEIGRLIDDLITHAVKRTQSYDEVLDARAQILALELLTGRLQQIASWTKRENPAEDPFEII